MTDTQTAALKGSNGTATRVVAPIGLEKVEDGATGGNRHNGAHSSPTHNKAATPSTPTNGTTNSNGNGNGNGNGHGTAESKDGGSVKSSAKKRRKVNHGMCQRVRAVRLSGPQG